MDNTIPPMSPDDFAALAGLAKNLYQESKLVESFVSDNPVHGEDPQAGSRIIKEQLEKAQRMARENAIRMQQLNTPPQPIINPAIVGGPSDVIPPEYFNPNIPLPSVVTPPQYPQQAIQPPVDNTQLELKFDASKQDITNDLLREISKKLTKILEKLEERPIPEKKHVKKD
jgi:hypothetical protein